MKKIKRINWLCLLLILFVTFCSACNAKTETGELTLNASSVTLHIGETFALQTSLNDVTFSSENDAVASVDDKGRVLAVATGTTKIFATKGQEKAECSFTVKSIARPVTYSVQVSETQAALTVGETLKISASVLKNGEYTTENATFSSAVPTVATVNADGEIKAIAAGETVVTAQYGEAQASCRVQVFEGTLRLVLNQTSAVIHCGETTNLQVTLYKNGAEVQGEVIFSSNNGNVTVKENGEIMGAFCGESIVKAQSGAVSAYCKIRVEREEKLATAEDFEAIEDNPYVRYTLANDIDFAKYQWKQPTIVRRLSSVFDGNGYKLYNLTRTAGGSHTAIFGELTETAKFQNVAVYVDSYYYKSDCGVLAHTNRGTIENCYIKASCTATDTTTDTLLQSGMVNENYGTINNLLIDITLKVGSNQKGRFHALAAKNMGSIENCIVVSAGTLSYSITDENGNKVSHKSYQLLSCPDNDYLETTAANTHNALDKRRKNCIIFETAGNLLAFFSGGYAIDGSIGYVTDVTMARITETPVFDSFSKSVWTFNSTAVTFFGTELYTA